MTDETTTTAPRTDAQGRVVPDVIRFTIDDAKAETIDKLQALYVKMSEEIALIGESTHVSTAILAVRNGFDKAVAAVEAHFESEKASS